MTKSAVRWDIETDVVVVGAGLAGYCAALQAAQDKLKVVLVEKMPEVGGTSGMSGGLFAFAGTDLQKEHDIEDSNEKYFDDLSRVGNYMNDEKLLRVYIDNQLETYHWLRDRGVKFEHPEASSGQSVPRSHPTKSWEVIKTLSERASESDFIQLMTASPVTKLVRLQENSRVEGVVLQSGGKEMAIRGKRAVILTAGGFSRNQKLLKTFAPMQVGVNTVCGKGCMGDGLLMAWKLGADLRDMAYVKSTFGNHPDSGSERHLLLFPVYRGAIAVNKKGKRFVNESLSYKLLGDACLAQPEAMSYQVFDQTVMDKTSPGVLTFDFEEALRDGYMIKGDSISDLAGKIGVDVGALTETINKYNSDIAGGCADEFGRTAMSNQFGSLVKLDTAPFYAYPSVNVMLGTYCGLAVNSKMEVLDVFGNAIEGLYAAGEVMGGFHGAAYMTGSGLGKAAIYGRLAAKSAVA